LLAESEKVGKLRHGKEERRGKEKKREKEKRELSQADSHTMPSDA
jgi:hypothetical protein